MQRARWFHRLHDPHTSSRRLGATAAEFENDFDEKTQCRDIWRRLEASPLTGARRCRRDRQRALQGTFLQLPGSAFEFPSIDAVVTDSKDAVATKTPNAYRQSRRAAQMRPQAAT